MNIEKVCKDKLLALADSFNSANIDRSVILVDKRFDYNPVKTVPTVKIIGNKKYKQVGNCTVTVLLRFSDTGFTNTQALELDILTNYKFSAVVDVNLSVDIWMKLKSVREGKDKDSVPQRYVYVDFEVPVIV